MVDKGNHRHFMAKEIYEQPETISHTLSHYVDMGAEKVALRETLPFDFADLTPPDHLAPAARPIYAGAVAKYWFERYARLPVDVDVASEFRYREPPLEKGGLSLFISQSGETADTLAALRYCAGQGQHVASLVNTPESTIARESEVVFPILCGPEIGVASTKALTAQLTALASLAIAAGRARGVLERRAGGRAGARADRAADRRLGGAGHRRPDHRHRQAPVARPRTCSISAAGRCSRSPWKAR